MNSLTESWRALIKEALESVIAINKLINDQIRLSLKEHLVESQQWDNTFRHYIYNFGYLEGSLRAISWLLKETLEDSEDVIYRELQISEAISTIMGVLESVPSFKAEVQGQRCLLDEITLHSERIIRAKSKLLGLQSTKREEKTIEGNLKVLPLSIETSNGMIFEFQRMEDVNFFISTLEAFVEPAFGEWNDWKSTQKAICRIMGFGMDKTAVAALEAMV